MTITLNGTTGITTPAVASSGGDTNATLAASTSVTTPLVTNAGTLALSATGSNIVTASTNGAERMRIDSSGDVAMGVTSSVDNARLTVRSKQTDFSGSALVVQNGNTTNLFRVYNSGAISGVLGSGAGTNTVKYNTSTGFITYDTSSARYKDNIRDSVYGLDAVMQMRSTQFEYKDDGRSDVGLIAEELQPIVPELVGLDKDGLADSVSYDRMVSVLVKAIQELKAELDTVKTELATLKGTANGVA